MKSAGSSNFFENQAAEVKTENYMMIIGDPEFASEANTKSQSQCQATLKRLVNKKRLLCSFMAQQATGF
jgi:hypothetical protein